MSGSWTWSRSRSAEAALIRLRDLGSAAMGTIDPLPGSEMLSPRSTPDTPSGSPGPMTTGSSPQLSQIGGQAKDLSLDSAWDRQVVRADQTDPHRAHSRSDGQLG